MICFLRKMKSSDVFPKMIQIGWNQLTQKVSNIRMIHPLQLCWSRPFPAFLSSKSRDPERRFCPETEQLWPYYFENWITRHRTDSFSTSMQYRGSCRICRSRQRVRDVRRSIRRCVRLKCRQSTSLNNVQSPRCRSNNFASLKICLSDRKTIMMTARLCDQTSSMTVMSRYSNVCSPQTGTPASPAIGKLTNYRGSCHICPSDAACHECGNRFRTQLCQLAMHAVYFFKSCSII